MMVFRHADPRFPFLWESAAQPAARWHDEGDGPVHYLAETPDGAWAEFLRHEGITDPEDLAGVERAIWAVDLPALPRRPPALPVTTMAGGTATYPRCRTEVRRLRARGIRGIVVPSAALRPRTPSGFRADAGLRRGPVRKEHVFVLFGPRPELVGWAACAAGRPRDDLVERVRPLTP